MKKHICLKCLLAFLSILFIEGCSKNNSEVLILWTDNVEFASYAELFNSTQDDVKVAAVYRSDIISSLPVEKGHTNPDLCAGSYLSSGISKHYFSSLNSIFSDRLKQESFYTSLLDFGKKGNTQFLLPVNFNLGALVYDTANSEYVSGNDSITFDQIKECSSKFNLKNKDNIYLKMGFAPQWNADFLYEIIASEGITFSYQNEVIKFNIPQFESALEGIKSWTKEINTSCNDEKDFSFKYLYTPYNKQVLQQKSLFAYASSDSLLSLSEEQIDKMDFKWLSSSTKITVLENASMIGIYKKSKNKKACKKFIQWFMTKEAQEMMLKRKIDMNLDTNTFGIANGFSSLIEVNEHVLPIYYKCLLAKIPSSSQIKAPFMYSSDWKTIKKDVLLPFVLKNLEEKNAVIDFPKYYAEWVSQNKEE
ncbi:MAG: extracellular solute-binding protein [Treponema sp.]|nr:extracellular solute-binding protein [Candidatus Treponema merdequi]